MKDKIGAITVKQLKDLLDNLNDNDELSTYLGIDQTSFESVLSVKFPERTIAMIPVVDA